MKRKAGRPTKSLVLLIALGAGVAGLIAVLGRESVEPLPADARADSIIVDKTSRTMTLFSGGQALRTYAVSLGRGGLEAKMRERLSLVSTRQLSRREGHSRRSSAGR